MKATNKFFYICMFVFTCVVSSCNNSKKANNNFERQEIISEIESYKSQLPIEINGSGIFIDDIQIEDNMIVYSCKFPHEMWETMYLGKDESTSDRNMARVISNFDSELVQKFIDIGLGLKYIYKSAETGEILMEIEMSSEKMEEISRKLQNDEIEPYTMIELSQMELAKMEIPSQLEEGVWLTDAYVKGNNIYYIATIENEIDKEDLSYADLEEIKEGCVEGLREEKIIALHKKEVIRENIHFIYIYKDSRGIEFARINISPEDIF